MSRLEISLLGSPQISLDRTPVTDLRSDKGWALLSYLLLHTHSPCRREVLTGLLWPDQPDSDALRNLRQALVQLRRAIGDHDANPAVLQISRKSLQFNLESNTWVDMAAFTEAVSACRGHEHAAGEDCDSCVRYLRAAAELYRDNLMAGFSVSSAPFEQWLLTQREALHQQALWALHRLGTHWESLGDYERAIECARRQVALEPWREEAHRQWMRALALTGRRNEALAQYEACRRVLSQELGVEPEEETQALYRRIRDGTQAAQSVGSPQFTRRPTHLPAPLTSFVGRGDLLTEIRMRLRDPSCRLLTLVGPGGSGKTRLALEATRALVSDEEQARFPDGVFFVSLAPLRSAESVAPAIGQATGLSGTTGHAAAQSSAGSDALRQQLLEHLLDKDMLLVLDNWEHLLADVAAQSTPLVAEMLRVAPGVKVLATSRVRLNLPGEHLVSVGGMALPGEDWEFGVGAVKE